MLEISYIIYLYPFFILYLYFAYCKYFYFGTRILYCYIEILPSGLRAYAQKYIIFFYIFYFLFFNLNNATKKLENNNKSNNFYISMDLLAEKKISETLRDIF
jgi:hypothetical protein